MRAGLFFGGGGWGQSSPAGCDNHKANIFLFLPNNNNNNNFIFVMSYLDIGFEQDLFSHVSTVRNHFGFHASTWKLISSDQINIFRVVFFSSSLKAPTEPLWEEAPHEGNTRGWSCIIKIPSVTRVEQVTIMSLSFQCGITWIPHHLHTSSTANSSHLTHLCY